MKNLKIELKWSLIFITVTLAWMLMERLTGLHDEHIDKHFFYSNFIIIPNFLIYILALLNKRRSYYHGYMNFLQGFISGLFLTLFITLVSPIVQIIISEVITPDYFKNIIAYSVAKEHMSQEDAEAYFNLTTYIFQILMFTPVIGIFTSAIAALLTVKKKK